MVTLIGTEKVKNKSDRDFEENGCSTEPQFQTNPEVLINNESNNRSFIVQPMDELGTKSTFNRINPFSSEKASLKRGHASASKADRIIKPGFLPLQLLATSARYDLYQRKDPDDSE